MTKAFPVFRTPFWIYRGRFTSVKHGDL